MYSRSFTLFVLAGVLIVASGCSGLNKLSTGRTDRLDRAPHMKSYSKEKPVADRIAVLTVGFDRRLEESFEYGDRGEAVTPLVMALESYLDSLYSGRRMNAVSVAADEEPIVFVGSSDADTRPHGAVDLSEDHETYPPTIIYTEKPSDRWKEQVMAGMNAIGADYLLIVRVGFSQYPKTDKGLFKKKVVLGTGHEREIRFFSAVDKPVEVLQLTGLLLDNDGNILRAGAEGIASEDTPFWAQVLELHKEIDDETMGRVVHELRREDLPGQPLAWRVAAENLLYQLTR